MAKPAKPTRVQFGGDTVVDGKIAIKQEFDVAMKDGTEAALQLVIRRHPNSPWTEAAKVQLRALRQNQK